MYLSMTPIELAPMVKFSQIFLARFVRMLTTFSSTLSQGRPSFTQVPGLSYVYILERLELLTSCRASPDIG